MDFFRLLHEGVPLGIDSPIPPCKVLASRQMNLSSRSSAATPPGSQLPITRTLLTACNSHRTPGRLDPPDSWRRCRAHAPLPPHGSGQVGGSGLLQPSAPSPRLPIRPWQMSAGAFRSARPTNLWPHWCSMSPKPIAASASSRGPGLTLFLSSQCPLPVCHLQLWRSCLRFLLEQGGGSVVETHAPPVACPALCADLRR